MRSVEFDQDQLQDLAGIGMALFQDETDPRSLFYQRKLVRPHIRWGRILLALFLPAAVAAGVFFALRSLGTWPAVGAAAAVLGLYALVRAKAAALCSIRLYQRYAPVALRQKCRFEPSCSEYMAICIQKQGLLRGVKKGVSRLRRCNIDGGGIDYPA